MIRFMSAAFYTGFVWRLTTNDCDAIMQRRSADRVGNRQSEEDSSCSLLSGQQGIQERRS
jgi:hypothetical protein